MIRVLDVGSEAVQEDGALGSPSYRLEGKAIGSNGILLESPR